VGVSDNALQPYDEARAPPWPPPAPPAAGAPYECTRARTEPSGAVGSGQPCTGGRLGASAVPGPRRCSGWSGSGRPSSSTGALGPSQDPALPTVARFRPLPAACSSCCTCGMPRQAAWQPISSGGPPRPLKRARCARRRWAMLGALGVIVAEATTGVSWCAPAHPHTHKGLPPAWDLKVSQRSLQRAGVVWPALAHACAHPGAWPPVYLLADDSSASCLFWASAGAS